MIFQLALFCALLRDFCQMLARVVACPFLAAASVFSRFERALARRVGAAS